MQQKHAVAISGHAPPAVQINGCAPTTWHWHHQCRRILHHSFSDHARELQQKSSVPIQFLSNQNILPFLGASCVLFLEKKRTLLWILLVLVYLWHLLCLLATPSVLVYTRHNYFWFKDQERVFNYLFQRISTVTLIYEREHNLYYMEHEWKVLHLIY